MCTPRGTTSHCAPHTDAPHPPLPQSALGTRLQVVSKQIDATEDLLNLRLESIQKNTFVANALFHMMLTFLGLPTLITGLSSPLALCRWTSTRRLPRGDHAD
jgi:hypothetical protein